MKRERRANPLDLVLLCRNLFWLMRLEWDEAQKVSDAGD